MRAQLTQRMLLNPPPRPGHV
uniref:Oncostatin M n=2 Tax=Equus TaxID=9789 RepID=A0A5F5PKV8_HORSE